MELFTKLGIDGSYIVIGLLCIVLIMIILYIVLIRKFTDCKMKYEAFMKGSDGKTLEDTILARFLEIEEIKDNNDRNTNDVAYINDALRFTFQKFAIIKYDAFKEMGGKLSFSICMLTDNDDGFILTSVHNNLEGCYTYVKEIIQGEAFVLLSEDEKKVLAQAKNRRSCLDE